jgi:hypothetical protein
MTAGTSPIPRVPEPVPVYCRTCRRALSRVSRGGTVDYIHAAEQRGEHPGHRAQPAPLTEISDPIIECDFCSAPDGAWIYTCDDQQTDLRIVTSTTVDLRDYHQRHHAARTRNVETTAGPVQIWGQRWSACHGCAALIETRDLMGLIARVTAAMPAKVTRGKRLMLARALLWENYRTVFATLRPGRGEITADHPLGRWDPPDDPAAPRPLTADDAGSGPAAE